MAPSARSIRRAALILAVALPTQAKSIHIAPDGDDSRTTLQVQDPGTPWKTLGKLATVALQPGDSVLLLRGGTWRETFRLTGSGTSLAPVVVSSYGAGSEFPRILGSDSIFGASNDGLLTARVSGGPVARVFAAGAQLPVARFPDTGWLVATAVEKDTAITSPQTSGVDWLGASIHLRSSMWTLETHKVERQSGGRIAPDTKAVNIYPDSVRFYLSNHVSAMSTDRESWSFSVMDSVLRWRGPHPSVEASVRPYNVDLGSSNWVAISGLRLENAAQSALRAPGKGISVDGCEIVNPDQNGVELLGRDGRISNNRVAGANRYGIVTYGANQQVTGNEVVLTAQMHKLGPKGMGNGCCAGRALEIESDSSVIRDNRIDSSGYIGIGFRGLDTRVEENVVSHSCMTTDDCAGIYTWTGSFDKPGSAGSVIRRNIVRDAVGERTGWAHPWAASQGIYLDDASHDIRVDSNVSTNNDIGLFLHNNRNIVARGNILFGNRASQIQVSHDKIVMDDAYGSLLERNVLVALPGQTADVAWSITNPQNVPLGEARSNAVCLAQSIWTTCDISGVFAFRSRRLQPDDSRLGREVLRNVGFDSSALGWTAWPGPFAKVQRDSTPACGTGRCLKITYGNDTAVRNPLAGSSSEFAVEPGQAWWLRFRAKAQRPGQSVSVVLRRGYGNYAPLGLNARQNLDTAWKEYEFLATISESDARARVDFHNSATDSVWWLDDATMKRVPDSLLPNDAGAALGINPGSGVASWSPGSGRWVDAWGMALPRSVDIPPYFGQAAIWSGAGTGVGNGARAPVLRAHREGGAWVVEGLVGPATVLDVRGRTLAVLTPTATGRAFWRPTASAGLVWVKTHDRSICLVPYR